MPGEFTLPNIPQTEIEAQHNVAIATMTLAEQISRLVPLMNPLSSHLERIGHKLDGLR